MLRATHMVTVVVVQQKYTEYTTYIKNTFIILSPPFPQNIFNLSGHGLYKVLKAGPY
jgi:hypothetical protein